MDRRIVIAEGNPDGRDALERLLASWGHEVHTAGSGAEALHLVRLRDPEVLVLEMLLPDMNGWELVHRLRTEGYATFAVGYCAIRALQDHALEAGCDAYVVKPAIEPLRTILQSAPRRRAASE